MSSNWSRRLRDEMIGRDLDPYLEAAGYGDQFQADQDLNSPGTRGIEQSEPPFRLEDLLCDSDEYEDGAAVAEGEDEAEPTEQRQVNNPPLSQPSSKREPTKAGSYGPTQDPLRKDSLHPSYQPYEPIATSSALPQTLTSSGEQDQDRNMRQPRAIRKNKTGTGPIPPTPHAEGVVDSQNHPDAEDANGFESDAALDESDEVSYWDSLGLPPLAAGAKHPQRIPAETLDDDFELIYKKKSKWIQKILRAINTAAQTSKDHKGLSAKKKKKLNRFCRKQIAELKAKSDSDLYDRVDTMVMNVIFIHREGFFPDTEVNGTPAANLDVEGDMTCTERMEKLLAAIASEAVLAFCIVLGADMTKLLLRPTTFAIGDDIRVPGLEEWEDDGGSEGNGAEESGVEGAEDGAEGGAEDDGAEDAMDDD